MSGVAMRRYRVVLRSGRHTDVYAVNARAAGERAEALGYPVLRVDAAPSVLSELARRRLAP